MLFCNIGKYAQLPFPDAGKSCVSKVEFRHFTGFTLLQDGQRLQGVSDHPLSFFRSRMQYLPTADGTHWRVASQDKTVPTTDHHRLVHTHLGITTGSGLEFISVQEYQSAHFLIGAGVETDLCPVFQNPWRSLQMLQAYIYHERGNQTFRGCQHIAPLKGGLFQALKVNGRALPTDGLTYFPIMDLNTTHLGFEQLRIDK